MDRKAIQAKLDAATAAISAIFALCDTEKRAQTDDERKKVAEHEAAYDAAKAEMAQLDEDDKARERQKAREAAAKTPKPRQATTDQPGSHIGDPKDNFIEDPNKGFKDHREFLTLVMQAGARGGVSDDKRLRYLSPVDNPSRYAAAGSDEQSTVSDAYGGFLLPSGLTPTILSRGVESDPTAGRTTPIPMNTATLPINARVDSNHSTSVSGGFTVGRREETQAGTASRQAYEQVVLNAHSLFGLAYASEEILARSPVSFMALIEAGFRDEFPAKLLREKLNGAPGGYRGVIGAAGTVDVAKRTGQGAATIIYENLVDMMSRCWRYGSAIWLYNHDTLPQLMTCVQQVGTAGVPAWQPSMRDDHPQTILGRPAFPTEFCKTLGTSGDIILGVWSEYLEGTLTGMNSAESMHVRFENHERVFKFWQENDGTPWWRAPLTPAVSSVTLSPFVTLAVRA